MGECYIVSENATTGHISSMRFYSKKEQMKPFALFSVANQKIRNKSREWEARPSTMK